jgi:hypothetical protein
MEVYLLSLPLARHRTIAAHPRRGLISSAVLGAAEPTANGPDPVVNPTERQTLSAALQRNHR